MHFSHAVNEHVIFSWVLEEISKVQTSNNKFIKRNTMAKRLEGTQN